MTGGVNMAYLLHIRFDFKGKTGNKDEDIAHTFPFDIATAKMNALPNLKRKNSADILVPLCTYLKKRISHNKNKRSIVFCAIDRVLYSYFFYKVLVS